MRHAAFSLRHCLDTGVFLARVQGGFNLSAGAMKRQEKRACPPRLMLLCCDGVQLDGALHDKLRILVFCFAVVSYVLR